MMRLDENVENEKIFSQLFGSIKGCDQSGDMVVRTTKADLFGVLSMTI